MLTMLDIATETTFFFMFLHALVVHPEQKFDASNLSSFQCIINYGALPCLLNLLSHNYKKSIKKEACWTISNITAGNKDQIQVSSRFICGKQTVLHDFKDIRLLDSYLPPLFWWLLYLLMLNIWAFWMTILIFFCYYYYYFFDF